MTETLAVVRLVRGLLARHGLGALRLLLFVLTAIPQNAVCIARQNE